MYTLFDIIRDKILDYFDYPHDADPKRMKQFKIYLTILFVTSLVLALVILYFINGDQLKLLSVGVCLIIIGISLGILHKSNPRRKQRIIEWWHGNGKWYDILK
jgi:undecaprenyl pyrophosphate phosphatase UppP